MFKAVVICLSLVLAVAYGMPSVEGQQIRNTLLERRALNASKPMCLPYSGLSCGFTQGATVYLPTGTSGGINEGKMYINYDKQMVMMDMTTETAKGPLKIAIYRYGAVQYNVYPSLKFCQKGTGYGDFSKCLPDTAKYLGERKYGDSKNPTVASVWSYEQVDAAKNHIKAQVSFTKDTFFPIANVMTSTGGANPAMQSHMEIYDVEMKVPDNSIFDLPDYCKKV